MQYGTSRSRVLRAPRETRVDGNRVRRPESRCAGDQRATGAGTAGIRTRDHMLMTNSSAPAS